MSGVRIRPLLRRLSSLGRIFIALALLAAVWVTAAAGVEIATDQAEERRLEDRRELAKAYAAPLASWLAAARNETAVLVAGLANASAPGPVVERHLTQQRQFANEVAVLTPDLRLVTGSTGPASFTNRQLQPCTSGEAASRWQLKDLVAAAGRGERPVWTVSVPWNCDVARVAVAVPAGPNVVVVMAPRASLDRQLSSLRIAGVVPSVIEPFYERVEDPDRDEPSASQQFVASARGRTGVTSIDGGVVRAYADAGSLWGVLIEQPESAYAPGGIKDQPLVVQLFGATFLAGAFALVFVLLAVADARRRRAHTRAEDAKHAFFATVGHELRTPLTILRGYSETLTSRWDALSDESKEMLVSNMAPAAQRMGALVEKLLLASNIQAEAYVKPAPRPMPVADVLKRVVERWRPLAPLHTFVVDADPLLPEAIADPDALDQVLQQLVDNAVKYSPSGGRVTVSAMRSRKGVDVAVTDDGVGLPPNARDMFDPLVQGEAVDTRVHDEGGAGVGLYIVRTLVRDMGGDVRAERREVPGSRFVVSLKAARTKAPSRSVSPV